MLMRADPFRELDRLTQQVFGGTAVRPTSMPMDAYRKGDQLVVHFDVPGVDLGSIDLTIEENVLTVRAERAAPEPEGAETLVAERPAGTFTRQLFLGDTLDADRVQADYRAGVLTVSVPVHEEAKPLKVEITSGDRAKELTEAS